MTLPLVRELLLWCTVLDDGVLLAGFIAFSLAHDRIPRRLHGRWVRISDGCVDAIHNAGMTICKIGTLLFNWMPCVALRIVKRRGA